MKNKIKNFLVSHKLLLVLLKNLVLLRRQSHDRTVPKDEADFRRFGDLSRKLQYNPVSHIFDNNLYGTEYMLKAFLDKTRSLDCYIEHGLFFGPHIQMDQGNYYTPKVLTFGDTRLSHLKRQLPQKETIAIGPYIHYAKSVEIPFLNLNKGKTLLYFPDHSTSTLTIDQNITENIKFLNHIKSNYNIENIVVCLYYLDIDEEKVSRYEEAGFKLFSCGSKWDIHFLSRLKAIIEKSDLTVSTAVGTHVGYCIYLKKPHTIVKMGEHIKPNENHDLTDVVTAIETNPERLAEVREIEKEFVHTNTWDLHTTISGTQYEICEKYWGFNHIKNKQQLTELLA